MARNVLIGAVRLALLLLAVSFVTFTLVAVSPVDPVQVNVGQVAYLTMGSARRAALHELWGTDEPLLCPLRVLACGRVARRPGYEPANSTPPSPRSWESASLRPRCCWPPPGCSRARFDLILGAVAAVRRASIADRAVCALCYVLSATPAFWLALLALMVFSVELGWFPIGFAAPVGVGSEDVSWALRLHHLALPALILSLTGIAPVALHTRDKAIEVLESPYARFARARGESERRIVLRHGLRNVAAPRPSCCNSPPWEKS